MTTTPASTELETYLDANHDRRMASYEALLRIPSISGLSQHQGDCRRAAEFIADELRGMGVEHVDVTETGEGGHPVVYGDWLHAEGAPTAIVYGHYDVQPVDPLDLWLSPPFEPAVHDGRMHARGAADDKGQIHMHLRAAEALLETRGRLPVNLRFVFEGDEESKSEYLDKWLEEHRDRLAADVAIISDTSFFEGNVPAITVGLRGIMYAQIDVTGTPVDVHSGSYGGAIPNPINVLATIIAGLKDQDGRILVDGFYDDVATLSPDERAAFAELPFDEDAFRATIGARGLAGEAGYSTLERKGGRPTLDVNGIWGGFAGEGTKTIIPAHAHAKVSCRLVVDQQPERIFERFRDHVLRICSEGRRRRGQVPRRWPAKPHPDGPPGDPGRGPSHRAGVRASAGLPAGGRFHSRVCELRIAARPAGRPRRLHQSRRQRPRPERVDGARQLRARNPGNHLPVGRACLRLRESSPHREGSTFGSPPTATWADEPTIRGATMHLVFRYREDDRS